ncbi:MAG: flagellar hook assembly protein FlgD [Proteobacteria bacterium]|nr:flagellar hook assembly protein FlgD [Pseudomonadota bacterium]
MTTAVTGASGATDTSNASKTANATTEASDRFLKLLVTQMQNQDPLNPLDNAEVTSQMAQISTVTGLQTLNQSMTALSSQFMQMQATQAAALVGNDVAFEGNTLRQIEGKADGGFELSAKADAVQVEIKDGAGKVVDTLKLGPQAAGRHTLNWDVPSQYQGQDLTFEVSATAAGAKVEVMQLAHQRIAAVSNLGSTVALELANGQRIDHTAIWAYL